MMSLARATQQTAGVHRTVSAYSDTALCVCKFCTTMRMNADGDAWGYAEMGDSLPAVDLGADRTAVAISTGSAISCALLVRRAFLEIEAASLDPAETPTE